MVLAGVRVHRPAAAGSWLAVALVLVLWGVGGGMARLGGEVTTTSAVLVSAGQLVAAAVTVHVVAHTPRQRRADRASRLDALVIIAVLGLVVAQLAAVALAGGGSALSAVVVPTVDVVVIGLLVQFLVTRRRLQRSSHLVIAAAIGTVGYDLLGAVQGRRLLGDGDPGQVLGLASLLLFGAAALHPTMVSAFDREALAQRRPPSASLLGLLPLVLVPPALWVVAHLSPAMGLPTPAFLATGAVVAGLCLLRGAAALRGSEHLAEHDPLTDLLNRRGLARAHEESALAARGLLLVDVDEFKQVNDTHGHDVGDVLLLQVRDRLVAAAGGGRVARLGGDEFVVLVPAASAGDVAEAALRALRAPVEVAGLALRASASIGVVTTDPAEPPPPLSELLTCADVAMYAAKAAGRDTAVTYHQRLRSEVVRRFTLGNQVRQLLGGKAPGVGRLEVHYQPLMELASGRVTGAEALVRWRHPEHGLLAPGAFLHLVSTSGLDAQLDSAVLREVVAQLARWLDQGRPGLPVSVNLTRDSLLDPHLAEQVLDLLARWGVPPALLHVEITEHEQLHEGTSAAASLGALRRAGVGVHLDDYGRGYTSLDYLRWFPVQVLKLDRSVTAAVSDGHDQVVDGIVAMAAALGVEVLAEGVETPEQRARLVRLGVQRGQGHLFSRPLPAEEYARAVLGPAGGGGARVPAAVTVPAP